MAEETKRGWIKEIVPGRTFADIGGLGGHAVNEMVTVAVESGASEATMMDVLPPEDPFWRDFERRCNERRVTGYRCLHADLNDPRNIGPWDVVHSSGLLHHTPEPMRMLVQLRSLCREYLILTSMVVPELIESSAGRLDLSGGRAIFVPAMNENARRISAAHFDSAGLKILGVNTNGPLRWWSPEDGIDYGPWWWLFPPGYVERLLTLAGFKVLVREETAPGWAYSFLCLRL